MGRRISSLAVLILVLFGVLAVQAANIQFLRAPALNASSENPRVMFGAANFARGDITAANGELLASSVPSGSTFRRHYPLGALTAGVVGFSSSFYGTWGLEAQYNSLLTAHSQPAHSLAQVIAPTTAASNISLTLNPILQRVAMRALNGRDGAVVAINPTTGGILAMYSNPTYDPNAFTSSDYAKVKKAWLSGTKKNQNGFAPLAPVATENSFPPGSTFKIIDTASVLTSRPDLWFKSYPQLTETPLPTSNLTLSNFAHRRCGGTIAQMLPPSCDTGFALAGLDLGAAFLSATAETFGFNQTPPLDLPGTVASVFPTPQQLANDLPGLAYSAIGQKNVRATTLQNALVAATIANDGVMMVPHLLDNVTAADGTLIRHYVPKTWLNPLTPSQTAQVKQLMVNVGRFGTASGVFPKFLHVGAKTGTSQVGNLKNQTDDWMIAFWPVDHPTIAVAVALPFQPNATEGATTAGPVMNCVLEAALAISTGQPASGTSMTCPK
jgi:peptidoglycan glycosyltransferase